MDNTKIENKNKMTDHDKKFTFLKLKWWKKDTVPKKVETRNFCTDVMKSWLRLPFLVVDRFAVTVFPKLSTTTTTPTPTRRRMASSSLAASTTTAAAATSKLKTTKNMRGKGFTVDNHFDDYGTKKVIQRPSRIRLLSKGRRIRYRVKPWSSWSHFDWERYYYYHRHHHHYSNDNNG
jgi:hypothetical protein